MHSSLMHCTLVQPAAVSPMVRDGLIAVNYAARTFGVGRHMRVGEALKACPGLKLVHVRTIGKVLAAALLDLVTSH